MIDMHGSQDGTFSLLRLSRGGSKKPAGSKRVTSCILPSIAAKA
jgi:hypothetical protein